MLVVRMFASSFEFDRLRFFDTCWAPTTSGQDLAPLARFSGFCDFGLLPNVFVSGFIYRYDDAGCYAEAKRV